MDIGSRRDIKSKQSKFKQGNGQWTWPSDHARAFTLIELLVGHSSAPGYMDPLHDGMGNSVTFVDGYGQNVGAQSKGGAKPESPWRYRNFWTSAVSDISRPRSWIGCINCRWMIDSFSERWINQSDECEHGIINHILSKMMKRNINIFMGDSCNRKQRNEINAKHNTKAGAHNKHI